MLKDKRKAKEVQVTLEDPALVKSLCGEHDINLRKIEESLGVVISARGNQISIFGSEESAKSAKRTIVNLYRLLKKGYVVGSEDVLPAAKLARSKEDAENIEALYEEGIYIPGKKKLISPRGHAQREYIEAIRNYDIVIGIGPAGTGKTYLAMTMAVLALKRKEVSRIILTRPAVEAGESLGYLPGDMVEKITPYLRPLYDALHNMMDFEAASHYLERGIIEVAPLAFMRGRTLNDSFVILDEAQNTTAPQMKMFLTRLGFDSKAVITGDITQVDLPQESTSGLIHARKVLSEIKGIHLCYFTEKDVVRHPLVQEIVLAYEKEGK